MSEVPSRGHRRGRNTTQRGRGVGFCGRGTQRGSRGRPDAQNGRWPRGGTQGLPPSLSHHHERSRGSRRESSGRAGVPTGNRNRDRNERDDEYEGSNDSSHQRGSWRARGGQRGRFRGGWRGGGTSRGEKKKNNNDSATDPQLDHESLLLMLEKDPDELVIDITSDRYLPAFESLLNQLDSPDKEVVAILRVLAKACDSETSRAFLIILLNKLINSVYISSALTRYINVLAYASEDEGRDLEDEIKCMIKLFMEILKKLPTSFSHLPLPNLLLAITALMDKGQIRNIEIKSCVEDLITLRDQMADKVQKEEKAKKTKRRVDPGDEAGLLDNEDPPNDYRRLSVIPQQVDIHPNGPVFIRRNKVEGSYDGPDHYLDVQFRLLREDFIRPLRKGIAALSEGSEIGRKTTQDIRVYNGVRILKPVCTSKGVTYEISFDVSKLRRILWENSKRLIYGSLLCLSKDNFETFILATVENRKPELLKEGLIQVRFTDINADLVNTTYQMAETTAYFEAYRHVLEGLQEINFFHFPFERYIVESKPDVQAPLYLRTTSKEVVYDLTCIMRSSSDTIARSQLGYNPGQKGRSVKILDMDSWPSAEDLELDSSQLKAVQTALTKEFAIIQGPPGTGKTYIGLKVAKVLLNNKTYWNTYDSHDNRLLRMHIEPIANIWKRPILLVCYTNHALDQFLEGIYKFHPEGIVRVGGQSQSYILQECNIRSIKETIRQHHQDMCRYYRRLRRFRQRERERKRGHDHGSRYFDQEYGFWGDYDSDDEYIDDEDDVEPEPPEMNSKLKEIYIKQEWIRSKFKDLYDELKLLLSRLNKLDDDIQKIKTTVLNETKLFSECSILSKSKYDSIVSRFKDENDGKKIKVKPDVMHYWLGLLTNTLDFIESGSTFVNPVAVYPLSKARRINALNPSQELVFHNVRPAQGIDGGYSESYEINGKDSYILIPNTESSLIDTRYSMTILLYVFPTAYSFGPIITFHQDGVIGIQIQIQKSEQKSRGAVLSVTFNRRDGVRSEPLVANEALEGNEWHYIAASYDNHSGILRVYQNGKMVGQQQNACLEIASHLPVHIGSLDLPDNDKPSFCGRVSSLQFFPAAISQEQIRAIVGIPEEDVIESEEKVSEEAEGEKFAKDKPQGNIVFEADRMEELRKLDVDIDEVLHLDRRQQKSNPQPHQDTTPDKTYDNDNQGEWQMQCPKFLGSRVKRVLKKEMEKTDMMTEDEANKVTDLWKLSRQDKWRLYRYWIETLCETYRINARRIHPRFEDCAERIKALHRQEDLTILREATIIGMTTTGAAKFRELIQEIQPRITIVEEAAEVLESHIVTSLSPGCEHLILIGDHQQLRPNPNVYELAKDYKLDVSLFERMVNNGMDYQTLQKQHRMRPEIAQMMEPIYEDLENHESVLSFENIKGVNKNIFFIEHNELEDFVDEGKSRSNLHEARYLAALCRYFILQGYEQSKITILTMYVGQLLQLKNETKADIFKGVRICAVDNFQGEENDIILLSLVRSNKEQNIGFLRISNRVCVALSRARKGFYCIGNLALMCRKEKLWATIVEDMRERGNVGPSLNLMCQNHPSSKIDASTATDFQQAPQGGCPLPCHTRLDCGHACPLLCHPRDPDHIEYECSEPCTKTVCDLGHKCQMRCYQDCGPCRKHKKKKMPLCNHTQNLPCYVDPEKAKCRFSCEALKCGHKCSGNCSQCEQGRLHRRCAKICDRTLVCGHKCPTMCDIRCPPCSRDCENGCVHQKCTKKCAKPCDPCTMPCAWKCEHFECSRRCGEPCNRPRCNEPCKKTLPCGHQCVGICGEPCPKKCRVCHKDEVTKVRFGNEDDPDSRFVELQPCGHVIEVNSMDAKMDECCNGTTVGIQLKGCPVCTTPIRTCPRYSNIIKNTLEDVEKVKAAIIVPHYNIREEALKIKSLIAFSDKFKNSSSFIQEKISKGKRVLTMESLKGYHDQVILLNLLSKILKEISYIEQDSRNPIAQQELKTSLEKEVTALKTSVIHGKLSWQFSAGEMSDQEQEDLRDEILRLQLLVSYKILRMRIQEGEVTLNDADKDDMGFIGQTLDSGKRIEGKTLDSHMEILDRIRSSYSILTSYQDGAITREDTKKLRNSNIGFNQGNWFKCLNGHIYSTADNCPKCIEA